jgi:hypothetical protein
VGDRHRGGKREGTRCTGSKSPSGLEAQLTALWRPYHRNALPSDSRLSERRATLDEVHERFRLPKTVPRAPAAASPPARRLCQPLPSMQGPNLGT